MNESWRRVRLSEYLQRLECGKEGKLVFGGGGLDFKWNFPTLTLHAFLG